MDHGGSGGRNTGTERRVSACYFLDQYGDNTEYLPDLLQK